MPQKINNSADRALWLIQWVWIRDLVVCAIQVHYIRFVLCSFRFKIFYFFFLNIGTESDIRIPRMNMSHYRFFSRQLELMQVGYVHDGQFIFSYLVR